MEKNNLVKKTIIPISLQLLPFQEGSAYNEAAKAYGGQPMHDPVHHYITAQNGPNDETFNAGESYADSSNNLPTYAEPYYGYSGVAPAPASAPAPGPYGGYNTGVYNPGAFSIQSGYDGYLVPGPAQQAKSAVARSDPIEQTSALSNFFPSMRSIANIFGFLVATVFGGGITTLVCFFTPLCSITFLPFGVRRTEADIGQSMEQAVNEAQEKLMKSAEKITKMEKEEKANVPAKITAKELEPEDKLKSDNLEKVEKSSAATSK